MSHDTYFVIYQVTLNKDNFVLGQCENVANVVFMGLMTISLSFCEQLDNSQS